jgi:hypothetical protein
MRGICMSIWRGEDTVAGDISAEICGEGTCSKFRRLMYRFLLKLVIIRTNNFISLCKACYAMIQIQEIITAIYPTIQYCISFGWGLIV